MTDRFLTLFNSVAFLFYSLVCVCVCVVKHGVHPACFHMYVCASSFQDGGRDGIVSAGLSTMTHWDKAVRPCAGLRGHDCV